MGFAARFALALSLLAAASTGGQGAVPLAELPVHASIDSAREASSVSGRPVVVLFEAAWCPPCRAVEKELAGRAAAIGPRAEWTTVDVDRRPTLANRYGVTDVPQLLVLTEDGTPVRRLDGSRAAVRLAGYLASRSAAHDARPDPHADLVPATIATTDAIRRPGGFRGRGACFSHVGYGPLQLESQSPFRAVRLGMRPHTPSTVGRGEIEVAGRSTWTNVWARGEGYFLDYEQLRLNTRIGWGVTDRLEIGAELEDTSRFGGLLDGLTQGFHDAFGIDQNGRDLVPKGEFRFDLDPGGGRPAVSLGSSDRGSFSRSVTFSANHSLSCGSESRPAISYAVSGRLDVSDGVDLDEGRGGDLGASVALAHGVGRVFLYGTLGYTWFGRESFRGLPLETTQYMALAAAEWSVGRRHALLVQYLLTDGVVKGFDPFSEASHEVTLGWKWEFRENGILEVGIIENVVAFDNGPDVGVHIGLARRF